MEGDACFSESAIAHVSGLTIAFITKFLLARRSDHAPSSITWQMHCSSDVDRRRKRPRIPDYGLLEAVFRRRFKRDGPTLAAPVA